MENALQPVSASWSVHSRALAWSGIAYALAIVAGTLLALPSGISERAMEWDPPAEWMSGLAEAPTTFVASMWVFHASSVALAIFGVASGRRWPALFLCASAGAFLIETTAIIAVGTAIAPRWVASGPEDAARLAELAAVMIAFRVHMALLASLLLAGGALAWGIQLWHDPMSPRWLPRLALLAGVVGALGGLSLMFESFSAVRTAGILLWTLFAAAIGVRALRGGN